MKFAGLILALNIVLGANAAEADVTRDYLASFVEQSVTISFVGDCTIGTFQGGRSEGTFNWYAEQYGYEYFLENVAEVFESDDITVANCEGVLTDRNMSTSEKAGENNFWFRGPAANAKIFSSSGVEVAGVVNNHANDYGLEGLRDTIAALEAEGLDVLKSKTPVYIEKNGITVGILGCGIWWAGQEKELYPILDAMTEKSDIQILFPHGGEEKVHEPESWRRTSFRRLIDRGADIIVAAHAHVLQPVEEYGGGVIVYGIGNFCFGGNRYPENRTAIFQCKVIKTADGFTLESRVIPCYVYTGSYNNWQPALIAEDDPNYQKIIEYMAGERSSPV